MKYSMYIGRVGALAVALGVGAAVATTPGVALAQGTESGQSPAGAEAPSDPPSNEPEAQAPGADDPSNVDPGEGSDPATDPPEMNASGSTVDTSTNDDDASADDEDEEAEEDADADEESEEEEAGEEAEAEEPSPPVDESGTPPADDAAQAPPSGDSQGSPQDAQGAQTQQGASNDADATVADADPADGGAADDNAGVASFRTAAVDNEGASPGTETFSPMALNETVQVAQDPISALITLPFRIVSDVLTAIIGGPNTPPGENPLFLGLLAFVRRQFSSFERTFSNQAPTITGAQVEENEDGSFTITVDTDEPDVDASDPDGDELTFSATDGTEGTVEQTGANTFVYTPGDDFDGDDTITLTASDPGGLFGFNRKTATVVVDIEAGDEDPTEPEVVQPPTQQEDGSVEAKLEFDPTKVTDVTIAEGFEPKYWTVQETYNEETGEYDVVLTPTQAGMLRAALGLDTTDTLGLQVTTTEETVQTFSMQAVSFAALAEEPDYTLELPDLPAGHFEIVGSPIVTSPDLENPEEAYPAGVVVTDRYVYVLNSRYLDASTDNSTVTVFGADPEEEDYNQVVDEIEVGAGGIFAGLAGDRLYVVNIGSGGDDSSISIIDTNGANPAVDTDDNKLVDADDSTPEIDAIALEGSGSFNPLVSPDGNRIYVINQQAGKVFVIDTDPADLTGTYNTVIDEVQVVGTPTPDPVTGAVTYKIPMSGAFNADGSRLYLVRDTQTHTPTEEGTEFEFSGELVVIDTDPTSLTYNEVTGDPVSLGGYGGYAASDGKFLYVPTLDMNSYDPANPDLSLVDGSVTVVDIQGAVPVLVDVDPATPEIDRLPVGTLPINIAFSPDKSLAYVVEAGSGRVSVIDTVNRQVLDLDPLVAGVQGIVFDEMPEAESLISFNVIASSTDGRRLYVSNFNDGTMTAIEFVLDEETV